MGVKKVRGHRGVYRIVPSEDILVHPVGLKVFGCGGHIGKAEAYVEKALDAAYSDGWIAAMQHLHVRIMPDGAYLCGFDGDNFFLASRIGVSAVSFHSGCETAAISFTLIKSDGTTKTITINADDD